MYVTVSSGASRTNLGAWPLVIWEATTAKRNYVLHRTTNVGYYFTLM